MAKIFDKYLVLFVYANVEGDIWKLDRMDLVKQYVLPKQIKKNYLKEKESINL